MTVVGLHTKFHIPDPVVSLYEYITIKVTTRLHGHYIVCVLHSTRLIRAWGSVVVKALRY